MSEAGLPTESLILQVTESTTMESGEHTVGKLKDLERFPVDVLKIDHSFVDRLGRYNRSTAALVSSVIDLTQAMGLKVVAEGVENAEQLERLLDLGCNLAQGYHFATPLKSEAVPKLLSMHPRHRYASKQTR